MKRILILAAAAAALSGCTIVGAPGYDPASGTYAYLVDLTGDGVGDGIISGCLTSAENPKPCGDLGIPPHQWLPFEVTK